MYSTCFISMSAGPDFVSLNVAVFLFSFPSAPADGFLQIRKKQLHKKVQCRPTRSFQTILTPHS